MRFLLDTHCWLWLQVTPERLSPETLEALARADNEILLSAASAWEISIKYALGKLPLPIPPDEYVPPRMARSGTAGLPVQHAHALQVGKLPLHHRDPFDRLLIAQAQVERLSIVTADESFRQYDVSIHRA